MAESGGGEAPMSRAAGAGEDGGRDARRDGAGDSTRPRSGKKVCDTTSGHLLVARDLLLSHTFYIAHKVLLITC